MTNLSNLTGFNGTSGTSGSSGSSGTSGAATVPAGTDNTIARYDGTDTIQSSGVILNDSNAIFVNDTANTFMTTGITINQGAADDEILTFKSSDISHSFDNTDSDTYGLFGKGSSTSGGVKIVGYTDSDTSLGALRLIGTIGTTSPAAISTAISIEAYKSNGSTGVAAFSSSEKILQIRNSTTPIWWIDGGGHVFHTSSLFINDTSNANMTTGITINQGTAADEILSFKASDVTHPFTIYSENDTFSYFNKAHATNGGLLIRAFTDGDSSSFILQGHIGVADPTDSNAAIRIDGFKTDGSTGRTSLGASERIVNITNATTSKWNITGEGTTTQSGDLIVGGYITAINVYSHDMLGETLHDLQINDLGEFGFSSSSIKAKMNITDISDTSWIYNLRPVDFEVKKKIDGKYINESTGKVLQGLIAEEVEIINNSYVYYKYEDDLKVVSGVNYKGLIVPMLSEIKKLKEQVDELQDELNSLKSK